MLDAYLHEVHVVAEKHLAVLSSGNNGPDNAGVAYSGTSAAENKAIKDLDKYMAHVTSVGILRAGKKMQKRKSCTHIDIVIRLMDLLLTDVVI
jgi:hypothetical protein